MGIAPSRRTVSSVVLGIGFGLTGLGTAMLGVMLPVLSRRWGLRDDGAGTLFLAQFVGSGLGAVFIGANRVRSIRAGYALLVVSGCILGVISGRWSTAVFFFFGLGLGMAMTSTSLLISDRYAHDRAAKLEGLNFAWSAGATAAPLLLLPFLRSANIGLLAIVLAALFLPFLGWTLAVERHLTPAPVSEATQASTGGLFGTLAPLVVMAMCTVGVESSLGGWLTTYAHRSELHGASGLRGTAGSAAAASLFWFGVMISRILFSTRLLARIGRPAALKGMLWSVAVAAGILIAVHSTYLILGVAALLGLCIGPLFPLLLSFLLERSPQGWIFAVAGIGSAVLPWMTGVLSAHFGSLRFGLIAPFGAAVLMIALKPLAIRTPSFRRPDIAAETGV
jgi:FHS family glucose/mannose:H+ symporter-like MFS transporter